MKERDWERQMEWVKGAARQSEGEMEIEKEKEGERDLKLQLIYEINKMTIFMNKI